MNLRNVMMAGAAMVLVAAASNAQVVPVGQRVHADNASLGVRAGSFLVTPKVDLDVVHNDNIYATDRNEESDFITTVRPEVTARSNWNRHALNGLARVEWNKYADNDSEDNTNHTVAVDGRYDIMRDTSIGGGVSHSRSHEDRGNPNTLTGGVEPTKVDTTTAKIGAYRGVGRFNARVDSEASKIDHKNGSTRAGALVDNSRRDRNEYTQSARVGYKATPTTEVFVKGAVDTRAYDRKGGAIVNRSSHGKTLTAGVEVDVTGKTKAEAYIGHMKRNYVDASLKDISGVNYGAKATWNASDLTTVTAGIDRGIEETTLAGSAGYLATAYRVGVEHAVMRNVLLNGGLTYANNDYKGAVGAQREDDQVSAEVGGKYYFNRNFSAGLGYTFTQRDSNVAAGDYDRNALMLRLTATY